MKSSISYFSEDPRKFTQIADLLIFGIGSQQSVIDKNEKYNEISHYQAINIELSHGAGVTIS